MINTYKLAKTWRYLMIIPSVLLFVFFWSLFIFGGGSLDMPLGAWVLMILVSTVSVGMIYSASTSKLVTSQEGIELISFGIQVKARWDQVKKIEFTPDGFVNLLFKEPIYTNRVAKVLKFLYPYDKIIQLSPYTGDLATNNLLKDIAKYVPHSNVPEFVAQRKQGVKTYQEAGVIGLYYLGWFLVWSLFAIGLQKGIVDYLAALGLLNTDPILTFIGFSLAVGLLINAILLIRQYNAEIIKLDESGISHQARAYYLSPFVIILISSLISIGIRTYLPTRLEIYIMFLIGAASLSISSRIERFLFRDRIE